MCSVELKKPMHPLAVMGSLIAVTAVSAALLYFGVPGTALLKPPASVTEPVVVPDIEAASLLPRILTVTDEAVPSELTTEKTSV